VKVRFLFTAALIFALAPWSRASAQTKIPRFEPTSCWKLVPFAGSVRCGFLVVPERRTRKDGKTIRVAVAIVRSAAKQPAKDPLVYLGGGPGGAPIFQEKLYVEQGLNADRDLILVNQRGTYLSEPALTCAPLDEFFARFLGELSTSDAARRESVDAVRGCRNTLAARGIDLGAFNTIENAGDFADLRRVLGIATWDVYGLSYGTDVALNLVRMHPEGIRSVILDSIVPPSAASIADVWTNARDGFAALFAACARQQACDTKFPDLEKRFVGAVQASQQEPVRTVVRNPATKHDVTVVTDGNALINWLVNMSFATPLYPKVPQMINDYAAGKPHDIAAMRAAPGTPPGHIGYGLVFGVFCGEWLPYEKPNAIVQAARRAFPTYPLGALAQAPQGLFLTDQCKVWNVPKAPASVRTAVHSNLPVLVLSGTFDAVTGQAWMQIATRTLPNAHVLRFPGYGHEVLTASACARTIVRGFLRSPNAPPMSCGKTLHDPTFTTGVTASKN
jgi:pimeloyl-ACP methyl ester carboxylesterase